MKQLRDAYSSPHQSKLRRVRAAFEYAVASMCLDITQDPGDRDKKKISEALEMLHSAAVNGHENSRRISGWLEAVFRPNGPPAVLQSQEPDWLVSGMKDGSRVCAQRLHQLDPKRQRNPWDLTQRLRRRRIRGLGHGHTWVSHPEDV